MELSRAPSSRSGSVDPGAGPKAELRRLVELLSDYECAHLLNTVRDIAAGEPFWEGDFGLLYNEYAKLRHFRVGSGVPRGPALEQNAFVPMHISKSYAGSQPVSLPPPAAPAEPLHRVLERRRSRRGYTGGAISREQLSTLLHHACGITAFVPAYGYTRLPLRTFPSHGGLQSPEVYLWIRGADGLEAGLYHYDAMNHALEGMATGDFSGRLRSIAFDEEYVERAAAVFLISAAYERLRWKYGDRAYRFACMDAGFVGQNVYLVSEAMGLGACAVSGFAQDAAEALIEIDGKQEIALLLLTVGVLSDIPE
jgi:SagB-type dehydrogenase family enzyme